MELLAEEKNKRGFVTCATLNVFRSVIKTSLFTRNLESMDYNNEAKENRLEELKINIIAYQGKIEEAERTHAVNEYTLSAWKKELKAFESEMDSLKNSPENEITLNFD
ncbi:hypothetical protein [Fibrobacter succinogenes]|nr:hypothetical protein [Fibrobacter succinogenes]